MQSHHLQGAHYLYLLKLRFVKIVNYGTSLYDQISGGVAAYIGSVLVDVFVSHCLATVYCRTVQHTYEYTNMGKSSQFRYDSLHFENSIITVFDTQLFMTDTTNIYSHTTTTLTTHRCI